ncbi:MAG: type II secretion system F family protein [Oscillospiraceae bacterium]
MPKYNYRAAAKDGKEVKGAVEADSLQKASEELTKSGLYIISIDEQSVLSQDISIGLFAKKPKPRDLSVFCRQFVSIINAGVSVISTLEMLAEQTENKMLRSAIAETKRSIEKGESLANAMRPHRRVFPDIFITMVEAGEASGSLDVSFTRMAEQFEKDAHIKGLVKKASIYPIVVCVVAVAVIIGIMTFVVPTFQSMFDQIGTELPGITKAVIAISKFMQNYVLFVLVGIVALVIILRSYAKTDSGRHAFGRIALKMPLVGPLSVKSASSRMSRTLSTLIGAGIPLIEALEITSGTMSNVYFKEALLEAKDSVAMGTTLSEPLIRNGLFPPLVCHMIKIGEETGGIDTMLTKLADYYDDEVEIATQSLMAALEPMIIILLAGIIGAIVVSVILPMAKMYEGLDAL